MHIGVLGLGAMGKAVTANVVRAGFQTTVWNRSPQPVAAGAIAARNVAELFGCDVVLSVLLDDAAIRAVILDSGVAAAAPVGTVHVCMSSISTGLARDLARTHAEHGGRFAAASHVRPPRGGGKRQTRDRHRRSARHPRQSRDGFSLSRPQVADGRGSAIGVILVGMPG